MPRRDRWRERVDYRVGHTINEILFRIPPAEIRAMARELDDAARAAGLVYEEEDGAPRTIPLLLRPRVISEEQRVYFHKVCLEVTRAVEKLARLYVEDAQVRDVLPFTEAEEGWLRDVRARTARAPQTVVARLDANVDFGDVDWDERFHFFETNSVGVGGLHYTPMAEKLVLEHVAPRMQRHAPALVLQGNDDMRALLLEQVLSHARAVGKRRLHTCFVQDRRSPGGAQEFEHLAEYFRAHGVPAAIADPRDLTLRGDEIHAGDFPVDVVYRDQEIRELVALADGGDDLSAMRAAFSRNQVVSSLSGEFDHKSVFEVLTRPDLAARFTKAQQRIFRRHVLWTRIVRDGRTPDFDGEAIDLLPWLRRNKERLVIKPNRGYGGSGIVLGPSVDLHEWDQAIERAVREPGAHVAQRFVPVHIKDFPVIGEGGVTLEEFYVVVGFLATPRGLGILGRCSKRRVVNVAQQGGLTAILRLV